MGKIISVCNEKGGVGKTTTCVNLAAGLVQTGKKVLCVALDPQRDFNTYVGYVADGGPTITDLIIAAVQGGEVDIMTAVRHGSEFDYIPSSRGLSAADMLLAVATFREQVLKKILTSPSLLYYDYIFIDCLPSLGILLTNALIASDEILIPVQAQMFALDAIDDLLGIYQMIKREANPDLTVGGVLLTMEDNTEMAAGVKKELHSRFPETVFETSISRLVEATKSTVKQRTLVSDKSAKLGAQYMQVVHELLDREKIQTPSLVDIMSTSS